MTRLLALLALAWAALAQPRATLVGTVRDVSDAAVFGATVTAWNQESGLRRTTQTGTDGAYRIDALPSGVYKVGVRRPGFQTQVRLDFELGAESAALDFVLQVGSMHEVITIHGGPPPLNTVDATVATSFDGRIAAALPLNGRGILSLIELAPGVVTTPASLGEAGQFSVSGQRQNANYVEVDGVSVNSGVSGSGLPAQFSGGTLPMMTAFGSTHTLASLEEIDELRVATSSFAPEHGHMPGANISLTTRSGTEHYHGSVSATLRNAVFDANDWLANARGLGRAASRFAGWSGTLGGPAIRHRTFFFASYEGLRLDAPYTLNEVVPPVAARNTAPTLYQPLLRAFPMPNGGGQFAAVYSRPAAMDSGSLRLDHAVSSRATLFVRYGNTPSTADSGYNQVDHSRFSTSGATLGLTAFPDASTVNDARFHLSRIAVTSRWTFHGGGGAQPIDLAAAFGQPLPASTYSGAALYGFGIGGIGTVYSGTSSPSRQGQWEMGDTLSWNRGAHAVRVGVDYERLTPARDTTAAGVSGAFWTLADLLAAQPISLNVSQSEQASSLIEMFSAFAQDTWRIGNRLTLTYGLRWELTPSPALRAGSLAGGAVSSTTAGTGSTTPSDPSVPPVPPACGATCGTPAVFNPSSFSSLWPTRYTQFAPRAGAAYRVSRATVLRAGGGIFYDVAFSVATDPINGFPYNRWQFSALTAGGVLAVGPATATAGISYANNLRLPYAAEWNVSLEHLIARAGTVAASYVGSHGVGGLRREAGSLAGSRLIDSPLSTNHGFSHYHALQLEYNRGLAANLAASVSYTYSHAIDNGSWDNGVYFTQWPWTGASDRGPASFDVRHNLTASLAWQAKHWRLAAIARARTGFPIDVLTSENLLGLSFDDATRPNLVAGVPVWNGRQLNPAAFAVPVGQPQGSLGRNAIRGFNFYQVDMAASRELHLTSGWRLELRADAYNAMNHGMPGDPVPYMDSPLFGVSNAGLNSVLGMGSPHSGLAPSLQMGSPRTLQFTARVWF